MTEGHAADLDDLRVITDYQFGAGTGGVLFPADADIELFRSRGGRPRQVYVEGGRVASYGTDGRFILGVVDGHRFYNDLDGDAYVVRVGDESVPFVRDGKNAFTKLVTDADPMIRSGGEVRVVGPDGDLLGVGRAELSTDAMLDSQTGMAIHVREGADEE